MLKETPTFKLAKSRRRETLRSLVDYTGNRGHYFIPVVAIIDLSNYPLEAASSWRMLQI